MSRRHPNNTSSKRIDGGVTTMNFDEQLANAILKKVAQERHLEAPS